ncbi:MAG: hypothetical protein ACREOC_06345 [Gemmatimonadales bacterium]
MNPISRSAAILLLAIGGLAPAPVGAQLQPPEPFIDRGLCPFECCTYREWTARTPVRVVGQEGEPGPTRFTLRPGERFTALGGNVHLPRAGIAIAVDTVTMDGDSVHPPVLLRPGDTVYVLTYLGEGMYHVWYQGAVRETFGFWPAPDEDTTRAGTPYPGRLLRSAEEHWWVQVRTAGGERGWVLMDSVDVSGSDLCGD